MDADFGQQSQAFTLLHDKNMLAPASAASWCPTMDLLALATSDGQLALSRLDWNKTGGERENRLWTANPDSPVTSLGWRPDGKILVSGHADGAVQLYHAEDGEVLHASTPHRGSAVTSLHWQDAPAEDSRRSACAYQSATSRFALPTNGGGGIHDRPRRDGAKADAGAGAGAGAWTRPPGAGARALFDHFDPPTRLTVLCSGDARGDVVMSAFGIFPIASARVADCPADFPVASGTAGGAEELAVLHASLAPNLSRILVAFRANGDVDAVGASAAMPLLALRSVEMCVAASHGSQIASLAAEIEKEASSCATTWRQARLDFDARIDTLRERVGEGRRDTGGRGGRGRTRLSAGTNKRADDSMDMDDSTGDDSTGATTSENADPNTRGREHERTRPTIEDLLLAYLATGRVDPGVEQFLAHEFQPRDVRRLARSVDAAATKVHAILSERIAPAAQSCALRIAELRALARWRERSGAIGLDERAADVALAAAESCALAAFSAARLATAAAARLRAFFTLLLRTQRQIAFGSPDGFGAGDDADAPPALDAKLVEEFLVDGLTRDTLGDRLGSNRAAADGRVGEDPRGGPVNPNPNPNPGAILGAAGAAFTAAVRAAAAAAGFGDDGTGDRDDDIYDDDALWAACARLKGSCAQLLQAPRDAMSRSLVWDRAFPIVRSGSGSGSVEPGTLTRTLNPPRVTHGGWSDDGESETLVFHAGVGSSHVGMLRLLGGVPESALALEAPPGHVVVDAAAYTEGRCLVLLQPAGSSSGSGSGVGAVEWEEAASVVMADPRALAARSGVSGPRSLEGGVGGDGGYALVDADALGAAAAESPGCVPARGVLRMTAGGGGGGARRRSLPGTVATAPLAVGRQKGLAAVLVGQKRIVLLDLEEDECDEDE